MHAMLTFTPGEEIPAANLTVLAILYQGPLKSSNRYLVRMGCCGAEAILAHRTIKKRTHAGVCFCQRCGFKARNLLQDEGIPKPFRAQAFLPNDILPAGAAWPRPANPRPERGWGAQA